MTPPTPDGWPDYFDIEYAEAAISNHHEEVQPEDRTNWEVDLVGLLRHAIAQLKAERKK